MRVSSLPASTLPSQLHAIPIPSFYRTETNSYNKGFASVPSSPASHLPHPSLMFHGERDTAISL